MNQNHVQVEMHHNIYAIFKPGKTVLLTWLTSFSTQLLFFLNKVGRTLFYSPVPHVHTMLLLWQLK